MNEVVARLPGVFSAEGVHKAKRLVELLGGDEEAGAVGGPFTCHTIHGSHPSGEEGGGWLYLQILTLDVRLQIALAEGLAGTLLQVSCNTL